MDRKQAETYYRKIAKTANSRLSALEKSDRAFWAYDMATLFTNRAYGKNRFKYSPAKMSDKGLETATKEIERFLSSASSTVRGSKAIDKKIVNTFREKHDFSISDEREFFNFLSSEEYKNLVGKNISSEFLIDFYDRSTEEGNSYDDILDALDRFRRNEISGVEDLFNEFGLSVLD